MNHEQLGASYAFIFVHFLIQFCLLVTFSLSLSFFFSFLGELERECVWKSDRCEKSNSSSLRFVGPTEFFLIDFVSPSFLTRRLAVGLTRQTTHTPIHHPSFFHLTYFPTSPPFPLTLHISVFTFYVWNNISHNIFFIYLILLNILFNLI